MKAMEQTLSRSRSVLHHLGTDGEHVFFGFEPEDGDALERRLFIYVRIEDWDDMGKPEEMTVTLDPGDRLND